MEVPAGFTLGGVGSVTTCVRCQGSDGPAALKSSMHPLPRASGYNVSSKAGRGEAATSNGQLCRIQCAVLAGWTQLPAGLSPGCRPAGHRVLSSFRKIRPAAGSDGGWAGPPRPRPAARAAHSHRSGRPVCLSPTPSQLVTAPQGGVVASACCEVGKAGAGRRGGSWGCFSLEVVRTTLHVPPALTSLLHQRACSHGSAVTSEGMQSRLCSDALCSLAPQVPGWTAWRRSSATLSSSPSTGT